MKLLLDTMIVLWTVAARHRLSLRAMELLSAEDAQLYLSAASVWEIAIKYQLGALPLHAEPEIFVPEMLRGIGLQVVDINAAHAIEAGMLPQKHRDPFDRMLVAQAKVEGMRLLTADRIFEKYEVESVYCGR